jgi:hypothetical protein
MYGVPLISTITYSSLRGTQNHNPNHGLLNRQGNKFEITEQFERLAKKGVLIVFDEFHNIKNDNSQFEASYSLVKALTRLKTRSKIALLSHTPCDKKEHAVSVLKMMGIITQDLLYQYDKINRIYELLGLQEAIDKCRLINPTLTHEICNRNINRTTVNIICHDLFVLILKQRFISSMPLILKYETIKDAKNGYYIMDPEDDKIIGEGINLLSSAVQYRNDTKEVNIGNTSWGNITSSLIMIESGKLNTIIRLVKDQLIKHPHSKSIIYLNYIDHMHKVRDALKHYNPLYMDGKSHKNMRSEIITQFQEANDKYRILITNPKVGGTGINLDDRDGRFPRFMYIIPNFNFIDVEQATNRIYRIYTKSKATIRIIYSKRNPSEKPILNSICRKKNVVRDIITTDSDRSIILLGEYEIEIEGDASTFDASLILASNEDKYFTNKKNKPISIVSLSPSSDQPIEPIKRSPPTKVLTPNHLRLSPDDFFANFIGVNSVVRNI